jgi:hypothetical protein
LSKAPPLEGRSNREGWGQGQYFSTPRVSTLACIWFILLLF